MSVRDVKTKLAVAAALGLVVLGALYGVRACSVAARTDDPSLIENRFWIERKPEKPTEYVHGFLVIADAELAVFERGSAYDIRLELAEANRDATKVKLRFPQTDKRGDFVFRVNECNERPPFDLCLEISTNPWGGPKRYYGFRKQDSEAAEIGTFAEPARRAAQAQAH